MTSAVWSVRFGRLARRDLVAILRTSRVKFGAGQASRYNTLIMMSVADLSTGPEAPRSIARDNVLPGYRSIHIARRGHHGRHLLFYRVAGPALIEIVRILHDSMDLARHAPPS